MCLSTRRSDTCTAVDLLFSALPSHGQPVTPEQPTPLAPGPRRLTLVPHPSLIAPRPSLCTLWPHVTSFMKLFPNFRKTIFTTTLENPQLIDTNAQNLFMSVSWFQLCTYCPKQGLIEFFKPFFDAHANIFNYWIIVKLPKIRCASFL